MSQDASNSQDIRHFDILIIGGGINGAGIALQAATEGYSVCLCDSADPGSGTSSASTKLIHGGLRYLEFFKFGLVREALIEREVLWKLAPHIIRPMRFILPHHRDLRPLWMLRLGLFIYDHLGGRKLLPPTRKIDLRNDVAGKVLKSEYRQALEYSDCWVEDSRLVILNLRGARDAGAVILPRTPVREASFKDGKWWVSVNRVSDNTRETITASTIVNAAGPWVDEVLRNVFGINNARNVRLVRGSHIVVRKKFEHDRAYIFQNSDSRIIFAIPYEDNFTLIGTTDVEHDNVDERPEITGEETSYLCNMASTYFEKPVTEKDVVWSYSGVRPLFDDGASKAQEATREYVIRQEPSLGNGTLLNIFGGKITTYRSLAKATLGQLAELLGKNDITDQEPDSLPGGNFEISEFDGLVRTYSEQYPFVETSLMYRLVNLYGTDTLAILGGCKDIKDMGKHFGCGLYETEIEFLIKEEWAQTAQDVLYRRTKLGIHLSDKQIATLEKWFESRDSGF